MENVAWSTHQYIFFFMHRATPTPRKAFHGALPGRLIENHDTDFKVGDFVYCSTKTLRSACEVKEIHHSQEEATLIYYDWPAVPKKGTAMKNAKRYWKQGEVPYVTKFDEIKTVLRPPTVETITSRRQGFIFEQLMHLLDD